VLAWATWGLLAADQTSDHDAAFIAAGAALLGALIGGLIPAATAGFPRGAATGPTCVRRVGW
jgi:hypothetical protein